MQNLHAECTRAVRRDSRRVLTKTITEHIDELSATEILKRIEDAKKQTTFSKPSETPPLATTTPPWECLCQPILQRETVCGTIFVE